MQSCSVSGQGEGIIQGSIQTIGNHGTIVQMMVMTDDGNLYPVSWDHRMFSHLVESLGRLPTKGERVIIHGEPFEEWVEFPDLEDEP